MKKLCVVLVLLLLFCGCQSVADNPTTPPTTTTTGAGDTTLSTDLQEIQRKNQVLQSVWSLHARYADVTKFRYEVDGVHTDENSKTTYDRVRIYTVSTKPIQDADGYEYYQIFTHRWCYVERESTAVFVENANAQLVSFEEVLLQELKDRKGGTPLVFVDSTNFRDQAYLLGAVDGGVFYPADCYAYNDRPLSDYQETEATVTGSILPLGGTLTFRDTGGFYFVCRSTDRQRRRSRDRRHRGGAYQTGYGG